MYVVGHISLIFSNIEYVTFRASSNVAVKLQDMINPDPRHLIDSTKLARNQHLMLEIPHLILPVTEPRCPVNRFADKAEGIVAFFV